MVPACASAATSRYASPTGSGTACTQASPCDVATAINGAGSGDLVFVPGNKGDYAVSSTLSATTNVQVRGPRDQVTRINQVVAEVDVEGRQGTQQGDVPLRYRAYVQRYFNHPDEVRR